MTGAGNHTYLLADDEEGAALIDAGVGHTEHLDALASHLEERHVRLRDVFVTHAHGDHIAGAEAIAAWYPEARFWKHPWREEDAKYRVAWHPVDEGDRMRAGGRELIALHTPGHSPDHLALWDHESRTAFTGDLVVAGGSVMIQASRGGDLIQYLASLARLIALRPARLLPAHGPEVTDPEALLRGYIAHRLRRERQVVDALAAGHDVVPSIAQSIYDGLAPALWLAAHENVRAHLEKLRHEGRAVEDDGRWRLLPT